MLSHAFAVGSVLGTVMSPLVCVSAAEMSPVAAAEGVVARVTPSAKGAVSFRLNPAMGNKITISGAPGGIRVEASDVRRLVAGTVGI